MTEQSFNSDVEFIMKKTLELIRGLGRDEEGAALIEDTVLLRIILVAVIATIVLVGTWITGQSLSGDFKVDYRVF